MSNESTKRFEDWEEVDCNGCARYWDSSCDGVTKDNRKPCNSFIATRSVIIPEQLKQLKKSIRIVGIVVIFLFFAMIIHLLGHIL